mmetsp:Transcript_16954/g.30781  ORF Transcript_16954/g.30781 Transcript_16954/m.30781 type:complete len:119 (-) Transcript_16954:122-478(-)
MRSVSSKGFLGMISPGDNIGRVEGEDEDTAAVDVAAPSLSPGIRVLSNNMIDLADVVAFRVAVVLLVVGVFALAPRTIAPDEEMLLLRLRCPSKGLASRVVADRSKSDRLVAFPTSLW